MKYILIGLMLGLMFGALGVPLHNYEVEKCKVVSANQYYEAQAGCYMPLQKPEWNLFWNVFIFSMIGMFNFGLIGLGIYLIQDF